MEKVEIELPKKYRIWVRMDSTKNTPNDEEKLTITQMLCDIAKKESKGKIDEATCIGSLWSENKALISLPLIHSIAVEKAKKYNMLLLLTPFEAYLEKEE